MSRRCVIFVEGPGISQLWPMSVSRPPYLLRCGATMLWEKWVRRLQPAVEHFFVRPELAAMVSRRTGHQANQITDWTAGDVWVLDGRWVLTNAADFNLDKIPPECSLHHEDRLVGFRFDGKNTKVSKMVSEWLQSGAYGPLPNTDLAATEVSGKVIDHLWDIVDFNREQVELDFESLIGRGAVRWPRGTVDQTAVILNLERVFIAAGAWISPQTVLDARSGAIIIDKDAIIDPHTYIEGPAAIGERSHIFGGKIRAGTTIGPVCQVGGEIEETVFLGWANKHHEGFIGHCVVGEWVNLGALTTNSDLKNNYRPVRVELPGGIVETGRIKVGSYLADHTKTGIGTLLPTGGTVGFASNVFGGGEVAPKMVPEFVWGGGNRFDEYRLAQAKQTAAEVCRRRGVEFSGKDAQLFDSVYGLSEERRQVFLGRRS